MSVYVLQWQVVLFIQGLLMLDAELTNSVGATTIGLALLALNLLLVVIILMGAKETVRRTARASQNASRRLSTAVRRLTQIRLPALDDPGMVQAKRGTTSSQVELSQLYSIRPEDGSMEEQSAVITDNPLFASRKLRADIDLQEMEAEGGQMET